MGNTKKKEEAIMRKKLLSFVLASVMLFNLTACGLGNETENNQTADNAQNNNQTDDNQNENSNNSKDSDTITVWAWDESFNIPAANAAAEVYKKDNPDVNVNVVTMAQDDIVAKLNTALSSGTYDGLPNIALIEDYRIQGYLNAYPDEFADLSSVISAGDFAAYKTGVNQINGKIYGVPFDSGVAALFYRKDIIEEAGYKEKDMQDLTWDKYIEIGKTVKEKCGVDWLTLDPSDLGQLRMMMQSAGAWYTDEDGNVNIKDNEALACAIGVYKKLMDSGFVKQVSDWDQFVGAFNNGDVATVFTGCWIAPSIRNAQDQSGKWAVASFPKMSEIKDSVNASSIGGAGWYVLKNVGHEKTAVDFLGKTFGSNADLMYKLGDEISLIPTLNAASDYSKNDEYFGGQDVVSDLIDWTAKVPTVNYGQNTYAIEDIMTEALQEILNGADIKETLAAYQGTIEAAVAQ